jgi:hypothetical protein
MKIQKNAQVNRARRHIRKNKRLAGIHQANVLITFQYFSPHVYPFLLPCRHAPVLQFLPANPSTLPPTLEGPRHAHNAMTHDSEGTNQMTVASKTISANLSFSKE